MSDTHEVTNQPPPLEGWNLFLHDRALRDALSREGAGWAEDRVTTFGAACGGEPLRWGVLANVNSPVLRTHDRFGHRIDEVEFHPAWHELMRMAVAHGLHALPWREPRAGRARRAGRALLPDGPGRGRPRLPDLDDVCRRAGAPGPSGAGGGVGAAPDLARVRPAHAAGRREDRRAVRHGDDGEAGRLRRPREHDARRRRSTGDEYAITGHKWFCSAPMCDAFLVLAQTRARAVVLPAAALAARRHAQPLPHPAAEGQARQPLQRVERGGVRRRVGAAASARRDAASRRSSRW